MQHFLEKHVHVNAQSERYVIRQVIVIDLPEYKRPYVPPPPKTDAEKLQERVKAAQDLSCTASQLEQLQAELYRQQQALLDPQRADRAGEKGEAIQE